MLAVSERLLTDYFLAAAFFGAAFFGAAFLADFVAAIVLSSYWNQDALPDPGQSLGRL